jgi:hypothetical protein
LQRPESELPELELLKVHVNVCPIEKQEMSSDAIRMKEFFVITN